MGKIITIMLAGIMAALFNPAIAAEPVELAPEFTLPGQSGQVVRLSDFKDKVVYLDFWASWCSPCRQSFPWMNLMQAKYGAQGLQVIAVNLDIKADDAKRFLLENPAKFLVAMDPKGDTPTAYKIMGMPTSLLIGPGGKIIGHHVGFRDEDKNSLESSIKQALTYK